MFSNGKVWFSRMQISPRMKKISNEIIQTRNRIKIGGAVTVQQILESPIIKNNFPTFQKDLDLFGSLPIRNRATIAGNIVNASPIGDLSNILIALDADIQMKRGKIKRSIPIRNFYKGYKSVDKKKDEFIEWITFVIPPKGFHFNYEKVSKRTYLDIASVNSTILIVTKKNKNYFNWFVCRRSSTDSLISKRKHVII